jgi:DNA-binding MarR family transcriptional regulator
MASFRYAVRKYLRFSKEFLKSKGKFTPEQYEALLALKTFSTGDGLTVRQLSERVQVKHHTAVSLTDKLAARRLVTKRRGHADRRHVYVKLTGTGERLVAKFAAAHRQELRSRATEMIRLLGKLKE